MNDDDDDDDDFSIFKYLTDIQLGGQPKYPLVWVYESWKSTLVSKHVTNSQEMNIDFL